MLTVEKIREVVSTIGKKYGIKNAYLFGSYARGEATEESDIDLIVDLGEIHKYKDYFHFCDDLETSLGTSVDVATEETMFPRIFELVKNDRILLYDN